jgi:hypothetical protein
VEQDGFVIIKNKNYKKCVVDINGTDSGDYHLVSGNSNQNDWHYFQDNINLNENSKLTINPINGDLLIDDSNIVFLNKLIKDDINLLIGGYGNNLNLNNSLLSLQNKNITELITYIFNFRKEEKEDNLTNRIIENSQILFEIINKNYSESLTKTSYNKTIQDKALVDKITQLNLRKKIPIQENSAKNYQKAEKLITDSNLMLKSNKYSKSFVDSFVAGKYLSEVW